MNKRNSGFDSQTSSELPFGPKTYLLGAGALVLYGLTRGSKSGYALAAAGGALAFGATKVQPSSTDSAHVTFLVNASAEKAYSLWRNFQELPRFMAHLKSVRVLDDRHSEWAAFAPMGREIRWNAEITEDSPNRRIAWRSVGNSDIQTTGFVEFRPDPLKRGTYVTAHVEYQNPAGSIGRGLLAIVGKHPQFMVREDLRRFKALLETGETPTTIGQTHGPRGVHGKSERFLFREDVNQPRPQAA